MSEGYDSFMVDSFLLSAINIPKDRIFLLKLDKELETFVNDTTRTTLVFPHMNSYQRRVVHHIADYFKLSHTLDADKKRLIIGKTEATEIPLLRINDLVENETEEPTVKLEIMQRKDSRKNDNNKPKQTAVETDLKSRLEEREAKYQEARARIFNDSPTSSIASLDSKISNFQLDDSSQSSEDKSDDKTKASSTKSSPPTLNKNAKVFKMKNKDNNNNNQQNYNNNNNTNYNVNNQQQYYNNNLCNNIQHPPLYYSYEQGFNMNYNANQSIIEQEYNQHYYPLPQVNYNHVQQYPMNRDNNINNLIYPYYNYQQSSIPMNYNNYYQYPINNNEYERSRRPVKARELFDPNNPKPNNNEHNNNKKGNVKMKYKDNNKIKRKEGLIYEYNDTSYDGVKPDAKPNLPNHILELYEIECNIDTIKFDDATIKKVPKEEKMMVIFKNKQLALQCLSKYEKQAQLGNIKYKLRRWIPKLGD